MNFASKMIYRISNIFYNSTILSQCVKINEIFYKPKIFYKIKQGLKTVTKKSYKCSLLWAFIPFLKVSASLGNTNDSYNHGARRTVAATTTSGPKTTRGFRTKGCSNTTVGPREVQILKMTNDKRFELDIEALESILLKDSIKDIPVIVVSVAGDFRKGMIHH